MSMIHVERAKFVDPERTLDGKERASVIMTGLQTLWFNTGTLCNLACENCYIESSPSNDALVYLSAAEVTQFLDEIADLTLPTREIGLTGGEPFMNPDIMSILTVCLERQFEVLLLTNAMRPMMKLAQPLLALRETYGDQLTLRVSVDHYDQALHEAERGPRSWRPMLEGLQWLSGAGFNLQVAGRSLWGDDEQELRRGFGHFFAKHDIRVDAEDPAQLVIFPEMSAGAEVPEITTECWGILGVDPAGMMCSSARMVVKHKGAASPQVVACTLLPHASDFALGTTLAEALRPVRLNHRYCAQFCVLGGGSCS